MEICRILSGTDSLVVDSEEETVVVESKQTGKAAPEQLSEDGSNKRVATD